jgi:formate--tetrahydrofolate ligase
VEAAFARKGEFKFLYDVDQPIRDKINTIATKIYGADGVSYSPSASRTIDQLTALGLDRTPICMAKTQYSFSDDATKLGRPTGFRITIREVRASVGAGFLVAIAGEIMTMPGLPRKPAAEVIDIDNEGVISGLF